VFVAVTLTLPTNVRHVILPVEHVADLQRPNVIPVSLRSSMVAVTPVHAHMANTRKTVNVKTAHRSVMDVRALPNVPHVKRPSFKRELFANVRLIRVCTKTLTVTHA